METLVQDEYRMLSQQACEKIREYIAEHQFKPGDRLPTERNLAEELAVSRPVIREALGTLDALGIIVKKQGKGIFLKERDFSALFTEMMGVWQQDKSSIKQLLDFRILLEQAAVEQIIEHATEADFERLRILIVQSEAESVTYGEFIKLDYLFHKELLSLTGNPLFIQLTDVINKYFHWIETNKKTGGVTPDLTGTVRQHHQIVELLKAKEKAGASNLIRLHLINSQLNV